MLARTSHQFSTADDDAQHLDALETKIGEKSGLVMGRGPHLPKPALALCAAIGSSVPRADVAVCACRMK